MPHKTALLTDWVTIGVAGPTIDGREIPEQALRDAAETYDPEDIYTATINADHIGWYGSFGHVRELRTAENKRGKLTLQARLEPNVSLMVENLRGQKLFFSMELTDLEETGKTYLSGLAITDEPASLGTTEMRFSRNPRFQGEPVEVAGDVFSVSPESNPSTQRAPASGSPPDAGLLRQFASHILSLCGQASTETEPETAQPGTDDMTPEEIKALMGEELDQRFQALEDNLSKKFVLVQDVQDPGTEDPEAPAPADDKFAAQLDELKTGLTTLTEKLTAALEKGNGNAGGQQTGAAGAEEPDVI